MQAHVDVATPAAAKGCGVPDVPSIQELSMMLVELKISLFKSYSRIRTLEGTTCCRSHPCLLGLRRLQSTEEDQGKQKLPEASKNIKHFFLSMCDFYLGRTKGPNLDTGIGYSTKLHK